MRRLNILAAAAAIVLMLGGYAFAAPIIPTFTTFGQLDEANFGPGISNEAVAITQFGDLTLGLTVVSNGGSVNNNGAGVYEAEAGSDLTSQALWKIGYYFQSTSTSRVMLDFLLYDFDPGLNTDASQLGSMQMVTSGPTTLQGAVNLSSWILDTSIPGFITPPTYASFDPNVSLGQYSLALVARDLLGRELGRTAVSVNSVPEPASMALYGIGLSIAGGYSRYLSQRQRAAVRS